MSDQNLEVKVNAFLNSVELLFHSNNKDIKKKANKFLIDLEKNADSWDIALQVLLQDNLPEEAFRLCGTIDDVVAKAKKLEA